MPEDPEPNWERAQEEAWRYEQALRRGVPKRYAQAFAEGDGDLHILEKLIESGCPPELAWQIA